jgi:CysZ protein
MSTRNEPRPLPQNSIAQVFRGLAYPIEALGFIRHHRLWGMIAASVAVNVALLLGLCAATFYFVTPWIASLESTLAGWASGGAVMAALVAVASWIVWIAAGAFILVLNGVVLMMVGQAVASPFLDALSEQVEGLVLGSAPEPFTVRRTIESILMAIADLVWGVVYLVVAHIPILLLNLVPVFGTAVSAFLSFSFTALLLSHEFVGLSMSRKLVSYRGRWRAVGRNKGLCLGFGGAVMVLRLVPLLNLLRLPLAAVGGTLLYCDLEASGWLQQ